MTFIKGNKINLGRKLTDYQKRMVSLAQKGKPKSKETRKKLSLALKGRKCPWVSEANKKRLKEKHPMYGKTPKWMVGKNNWIWKGNNVGYYALHHWLNRVLGKAKICSKCGSLGSKIRGCHWANISGEYKRDLNDWISLCPKCNKNDGIRIPERFKEEVYLYG